MTEVEHVDAVKNALYGSIGLKKDDLYGTMDPVFKNIKLRKIIVNVLTYMNIGRRNEPIKFANVNGKGVIWMSCYHREHQEGIKIMEDLSNSLITYDDHLEFKVHKSPKTSNEILETFGIFGAHRQFVSIISLSCKLPEVFTMEEIDAIRDEVCFRSKTPKAALQKMHRKYFDMEYGI